MKNDIIDLYDNGEMLLGTPQKIVKYLNKTTDFDDLIEYIGTLDKNCIVLISLNNGMGWSVDYFTESDKIKGDIAC